MSRTLLTLVLMLCVGAGTASAQSAAKAKKRPAERPPAKKPHGDTQPRKRVVVRLTNAPAMDVASTINELLAGEREAQHDGPGSADASKPGKRDAVIIPDPITNALVISATARDLDEIQGLIEELDRAPAMVRIEVLIAEMAFGDADQPTGTDPGVAKDASGGSPLTGSKDLSRLLHDRLANGEGLAGLVLKDFDLSTKALAEALKKCPGSKILSRPQIITLDNQPAFIQVGQRIPKVRTTQTEKGSVSEITYENTGLILGVTPRISPDGVVAMEIDAEYSQPGPVEEGIPISISADGRVIRSPRIDTTTAQTTVGVRDGQTIVLGGLITASKSERNALLIIVTPRLLGPEKN